MCYTKFFRGVFEELGFPERYWEAEHLLEKSPSFEAKQIWVWILPVLGVEHHGVSYFFAVQLPLGEVEKAKEISLAKRCNGFKANGKMSPVFYE